MVKKRKCGWCPTVTIHQPLFFFLSAALVVLGGLSIELIIDPNKSMITTAVQSGPGVS